MPAPSSSGWHRKGTTPADRERRRQYNSAEHRRRRAAGQRQVDAGEGYCWRCGQWIPPGAPWHAGHDDHDRAIYRGIECPSCNVRAAASKGARMVNGGPTPQRRTREW